MLEAEDFQKSRDAVLTGISQYQPFLFQTEVCLQTPLYKIQSLGLRSPLGTGHGRIYLRIEKLDHAALKGTSALSGKRTQIIKVSASGDILYYLAVSSHHIQCKDGREHIHTLFISHRSIYIRIEFFLRPRRIFCPRRHVIQIPSLFQHPADARRDIEHIRSLARIHVREDPCCRCLTLFDNVLILVYVVDHSDLVFILDQVIVVRKWFDIRPLQRLHHSNSHFFSVSVILMVFYLKYPVSLAVHDHHVPAETV